jgi:hypothetical protein
MTDGTPDQVAGNSCRRRPIRRDVSGLFRIEPVVRSRTIEIDTVLHGVDRSTVFMRYVRSRRCHIATDGFTALANMLACAAVEGSRPPSASSRNPEGHARWRDGPARRTRAPRLSALPTGEVRLITADNVTAARPMAVTGCAPIGTAWPSG